MYKTCSLYFAIAHVWCQCFDRIHINDWFTWRNHKVSFGGARTTRITRDQCPRRLHPPRKYLRFLRQAGGQAVRARSIMLNMVGLHAERSTRKVLAGERRIIWHIPRAFSPYSHRLIVAICATFWLFTEQLLFERKTRLKGSFPVVTSYFCMLYLFRLPLWLDVKKRGYEWADHHQHPCRPGTPSGYNAELSCNRVMFLKNNKFFAIGYNGYAKFIKFGKSTMGI